MADQEKRIRELEEQFPLLAGAAFGEARRKALEAGENVLESDNGVIYEVSPDGTRRRVKEIEPPTSVVPGTRIEIP